MDGTKAMTVMVVRDRVIFASIDYESHRFLYERQLVEGNVTTSRLVNGYIFEDAKHGYTRLGHVSHEMSQNRWREPKPRQTITTRISSDLFTFVDDMILKGLAPNRSAYVSQLLRFKERHFNDTLGGIITPTPQVPEALRPFTLTFHPDEDVRNWLLNQTTILSVPSIAEVMFSFLVEDYRYGSTLYYPQAVVQPMTYRTGVDFEVAVRVTSEQQKYVQRIISKGKRRTIHEYLLGLTQREQSRRFVHSESTERARGLAWSQA